MLVLTEFSDKLTRYISVTIFSVYETDTEFEKNVSRAAKLASKAGPKTAGVAAANLSAPSLIDVHTCDEETGMTAFVKDYVNFLTSL